MRLNYTTIITILFFFSCKVEELKTPPIVKTNSSSEIESNSAKIWGELVEEGSSNETERGFVYSDKNPSPTTNDIKIFEGFGKGEFNVLLNGLSPKTRYFFKAYASNQSAIIYGETKEFTTLDDIKLPTLSTNLVSKITSSGFTSGGIISSNGGAAIIEKGVVYGTSANPTISNNKILSTGGNSYSIDISGLTENTTYYIRAFATNSKGTSYGDQQVLTTLYNSTSILKNGLVAYYPFNGNANDVSGKGNNGTVFSAKLTADRFGISNSAYSFDGESDYINCGNSASLNITGSLTLSAWIYANNLNKDNGIISKWGPNANQGYDLITSSNNIRWLENGGFLFASSIQQVKWIHVVAILDVIGKSKKVYINGNLVSSQSSNTNALQISTKDLYIGAHQPYIVSYWSFDGKIDDVGIWNRTLNEAEIKFLYENDFKP
jgi:hypothetical protein